MTVIWETAETYDIVCAAIAIIFILFTLIIFVHGAIISIKEKKKVKEYLQKQEEKIEFIKFRIQMTQDLDTLELVKTWGLAAAENIKTELIEISSDYGFECGNKIIKEVKHLISMKEEDLISIEIL